MPWKHSGGGFTTKDRGGFVRNPGQYEKLRAKGMSKQRAAAITNSVSKGADMSQIDNWIEISKEERKRKGYIAPVALAAGGGATASFGALAHRGAKFAERLARSDNYGPEAVKGVKVLRHASKVPIGLGAAGIVGGGALARSRSRHNESIAKGVNEPLFYSAFRRW